MEPASERHKKAQPVQNTFPDKFGLHWTLGALIVLGVAWLFGILVEDVVNHESMTVIDLRVAAYRYARATPLLTIVMTFRCDCPPRYQHGALADH